MPKACGYRRFSLLTLLAALSVYAQTRTLRAEVPFAFSAAGKQFPAGQYAFVPDIGSQMIRLTGADGKNVAVVMIQDRTARAIHNTPADAHIVFDKTGETYTLSELWVPGMDGLLLNIMKSQHEHRVVNVPVK